MQYAIPFFSPGPVGAVTSPPLFSALQDHLHEYFITRDVTMNEVLILKTHPSTALFFYTEDAKKCVQSMHLVLAL